MISIDILSHTGKAVVVVFQEEDIERFYLWPGDFVPARRLAWIQTPPSPQSFNSPIGRRFREATVRMEDYGISGEPLPFTHNRIVQVSSESRIEHANRDEEQSLKDFRGTHRLNTASFLPLA